ncbi:hypothetical protein [Brasilonema octagenarum]|uniref:hypothetical protein n=1 Tax=Brasilonema octagenarum TaxID=417105 RepID=UPI00145EDC4A|nr:hypothetical protein [Brasilonema octagenarum]
MERVGEDGTYGNLTGCTWYLTVREFGIVALFLSRCTSNVEDNVEDNVEESTTRNSTRV